MQLKINIIFCILKASIKIAFVYIIYKKNTENKIDVNII